MIHIEFELLVQTNYKGVFENKGIREIGEIGKIRKTR